MLRRNPKIKMQTMSNTVLKTMIIGQKVEVMGKMGIVMSQTGEEIQVKFENGEVGFFPRDQVKEVLIDTRLKRHQAVKCTNCGHASRTVLMERAYGSPNVYQCTNKECGVRFSVDTII